MSFNTAEISTQDGRPAALYLLEWGNTEWAYTSADEDITYGVDKKGQPRKYVARAVSDNGMTQGGSSQNDFTVDCPTDLPICDLYRGTPPSETIWLTVRRMHEGEADAPIYWTGNVTNVKRVDAANAQIVGKPITASFKRTGLRLCWTRECPHFLYDSGCKVNPANFKTVGSILLLTGNSITLAVDPGKPAAYYQGGFIEWQANADGTLERRMIQEHIGNLLNIFGLTDGLAIGQQISMYPGCDRSPQTCKDKFNNLSNSGDFHFMPGTSPFGTQIF